MRARPFASSSTSCVNPNIPLTSQFLALVISGNILSLVYFGFASHFAHFRVRKSFCAPGSRNLAYLLIPPFAHMKLAPHSVLDSQWGSFRAHSFYMAVNLTTYAPNHSVCAFPFFLQSVSFEGSK